VLTPGRYVGAEEVEDDGEPFEEKMKRLVATLEEQFAEGARLEKEIGGFLRYVIDSQAFSSYVLSIQTGTAIPHISPDQIRAFRFRLPPYDVQQEVVRVLGVIDDKIENNRRICETLEAMARALFKSWFVEYDPVHAKAAGRRPAGMDAATADLFPDSFATDGVPVGWRRVPLAQLATVIMGQSPPGGTYNGVGEGLPFYQGSTDFGFRVPRRRVFCAAPTRVAERDDTLVSVRAPVGDINRAAERCAIGRGVAAVRRSDGNASYCYYSVSALGSQFRKYDGEGTVFGSISGESLRSLVVLDASPEAVGIFEHLVSPLDARIATNIEETRVLAAQRDALLPKLLSGELSVAAAARVAG
jgi:type I restriction enzyme S subunit